jgi:tetratricopeptide (TPR) repeat protein
MHSQPYNIDKDQADEFAYDFFISRRDTAKDVAREISEILQVAGYSVLVQDSDTSVGVNFVGFMHDALTCARHFIGLLTDDYDSSPFTRAEWTSFFALAAPSGGKRRLIILRVEDVKSPGLLAPVVYGDLYNVTNRDRRREIVLMAAAGRSTAFRSGSMTFRGVPPPNPDFTGREALIDKIHRILNEDNRPTAITQAAVHGLGGIGKTSLAVEYVHRTVPEYAGVWWAPAENRTVLAASLAEFAAHLDRRLASESDVESAARIGLAKLAQYTRPWLLVYDNVSDPEHIRGLIPSAGARVLITTRFPDWSGKATEIEVDLLEPERAIEFLLKRAKSTDRVGAGRLAEILGQLPLALDHAGAYVKVSEITFDRYAGLVTRFIARAPKGVDYPESVAKTFNLALDKATEECTSAQILLSYYSVFGAERIPTYLANDVIEEQQRYDASAALIRVSLIKKDDFPEGVPAVTVHRLVQLVMRERLRESTLIEMIEAAIRALVTAYPRDEFGKSIDRPRHRQILPHAVSVREKCKGLKIQTALGRGLDNLIQLLQQVSAHIDIEEQYRKAIKLSEIAFGSEHIEVANRYHDLADFLRDEGQHGDAEQYYRISLAICRSVFGEPNPALVLRLVSLGDLLRTMGRCAEAEPLLHEAYDSYQRNELSEKSDSDYLAYVTALNGLGNLYRETGRLTEAETMFRNAILIVEEELGPKHSYIGTCLNNLAYTLAEMARFREARSAYQRAITIKGNQVGPKHLSYAISLSNLAKVYQFTDQLKDAETLHRAAIAIAANSQGGGHPFLGRFRIKFSQFLIASGRFDEARGEAEKAIASHENLLGPGHRWTKEAAAGLFDALSGLGHELKAADIRSRYRLAQADRRDEYSHRKSQIVRPAADVRDNIHYCSICINSQHEVSKLFAGGEAFICNECVDICHRYLTRPVVDKQSKINADVGTNTEEADILKIASDLDLLLNENPTSFCSFCAQRSRGVAKRIAGTTSFFICQCCVESCMSSIRTG